MSAATRQADHRYATSLRGSTARARPYLLLSGRTHLDLALNIFNCVTALHLQGDRLAGERLYEYLHVAALCALRSNFC
jgi:hypothetical protein